MLEDLFGMCAERSKVISAEFLGGGSVARWECMLVGELSAEIGHAAGLGWIEVQLEPLVARAEVVNLEAPMALTAFVSELTGSLSEPTVCLAMSPEW